MHTDYRTAHLSVQTSTDQRQRSFSNLVNVIKARKRVGLAISCASGRACRVMRDHQHTVINAATCNISILACVNG